MFADFSVIARSDDLWAPVAHQLNDEDSRNINFSCPDKLNILVDMHALTEKSKQTMYRQRMEVNLQERRDYYIEGRIGQKLSVGSTCSSSSGMLRFSTIPSLYIRGEKFG